MMRIFFAGFGDSKLCHLCNRYVLAVRIVQFFPRGGNMQPGYDQTKHRIGSWLHSKGGFGHWDAQIR